MSPDLVSALEDCLSVLYRARRIAEAGDHTYVAQLIRISIWKLKCGIDTLKECGDQQGAVAS